MFQVSVNGELLEARTLSDLASADRASLEAVVNHLKTFATGMEAATEIAAIVLNRPRPWVANHATADEVGRIVAALTGAGAPDAR